jgi:peptide/nickel transport system permease protein
MKRYIIKRTLHSLFVIWLVATAVFFGMRMVPGGPAHAKFGPNVSPEILQRFRETHGLNDPLHVQYIDYWRGLLQGDLGVSMAGRGEVEEIILQTAPPTFSIAIMGILIGLVLAIPSGIISATRQREPIDYVATLAAFIGLSLPSFYIGILLVVVFGVWFDLLPTFGYTPLGEGFVPWFKGVFLPGVAVGTPYAAIVMRMMRGSLLDELNKPYMRYATAKGLAPRIRFYKHALQNAMIPVITIAGIQIALIITGSVTVELVFGINGFGRLLVDSMVEADYTLVQGIILLVSVIMVGANFVVDLTYAFLDPRIGYESDVA